VNISVFDACVYNLRRSDGRGVYSGSYSVESITVERRMEEGMEDEDHGAGYK
jgi:hypothetical protein